MIGTLTKFGTYKVERFHQPYLNGKGIGFYICAQMQDKEPYCVDAKSQLYYGLALLRENDLLAQLAGIYVDVNSLKNVERPAYQMLKEDILNGYVQRVLIIKRKVLFGCLEAKSDWNRYSREYEGIEVFTFNHGKIASVAI